MNTILGNLKSKTTWLGLILIIGGALQANVDLVSQLIPAAYMGRIMAAVGLVVIILRNLTTDSIADKTAPPVLAPPSTDAAPKS